MGENSGGHVGENSTVTNRAHAVILHILNIFLMTVFSCCFFTTISDVHKAHKTDDVIVSVFFFTSYCYIRSANQGKSLL